MKKGILAICIAVMMVAIVFSGCFEETKKNPTVEPKTVYVDDGGGKDYTSIQDAINATNPGDTVYVYSGMYNENIVINKTINLIGDDKNTTIIDGNYQGDVFIISADYVSISGFTIQNGEATYGYGIEIHSNYSSINNNIFSNSGAGIFLVYSSNNTISGNTLVNNHYGGICFYSSSNNTISGNTISENKYWDMYNDGIYFISSSNNTVSGNTIVNNSQYGIHFAGSSNNVISGNNISNNWYGGINFNYSSNGNIIYHNNLINNTLRNENAKDTAGNNTWYSTTLKEGNYWSDYNGTDANGDGIGDTPYNITGGNGKDMYTLMRPFGTYFEENDAEYNYILAAHSISEGIMVHATIRVVNYNCKDNITTEPPHWKLVFGNINYDYSNLYNYNTVEVSKGGDYTFSINYIIDRIYNLPSDAHIIYDQSPVYCHPEYNPSLEVINSNIL